MHKYQLQPYGGTQTRHRCPACKHRTRTFVRYVCTDTNEAIAPHVGRCSREDKCGYHFTPKQYFKSADGSWLIDHSQKNAMNHRPLTMNRYDRIDADWVHASYTAYKSNNFVQYLIKRFGFDVADELVGKYRIGTSSHWPGATVFWQIDAEGYARTGKIMLYNADTGKRVKEPFSHITWVHTVLAKKSGSGQDGKPGMLYPPKDFKLQQCFFGEHLLAEYTGKPVAICESEKTAIIASAVLPAFVWLASGSLQGLSPAKCRVLQGRQVMLFPDCNAYHKWKAKAQQLQTLMPGTTFAVSQTLENIATPADRIAGIDLADVIG